MTISTQNARVIFDSIKGLFEVYSIATKESLSKPLTFAEALDEIETLIATSGNGNGIDIRRVELECSAEPTAECYAAECYADCDEPNCPYMH